MTRAVEEMIDVGDGACLWSAAMKPRLLAELQLVNDEVNRELGADLIRYFAVDNVRRRLRSLDVPVLLVHGVADPRPLAAVQALAEELRRVRLVPLEHVGHLPFWESPSRLRATLRDFLHSLPPAG